MTQTKTFSIENIIKPVKYKVGNFLPVKVFIYSINSCWFYCVV